MDRRIPSATLGIFGIVALLAPSAIDGLMSNTIPFFLGFGPDFVQRLGATFVILIATNELIVVSKVRLEVAHGVLSIVMLSLLSLTLLGTDILTEEGTLLIVSHTLPYLFAIARTRRQRLNSSFLFVVLPIVGYIALETFDGAPPTREAVVIPFIGLLFGLPLAAVGWVTRKQSKYSSD
ncbi:hypothetical protein NGM10_01420 [Halorussus salilacus]|uniref:hypothetical protein n=1 Tax=Halorussus salilacus TaxID=2953750 RepID=UPI0020A028D4|nr:hypothetical protein [Halorussus salilacus]USZ68413.1 hypothetical protein NGM10_01420 [Halorussus salilacus]